MFNAFSPWSASLATPRSFQRQLSRRKQQSTGYSSVLFSFYHFVSAEMLLSLDQDDSICLEQRGCLHLPPKPVLYELIRQYFLHVHPTLPLINERNFWALYNAQPSAVTLAERIPLAVLQAMIFLACPFISKSTLADMGFPSARQARSRFYSVAKTLFYVQEQRDDVASAQVALMLTYHAPSIYDRTSSYWLNTAIHFATMAGANKYESTSIEAKRRTTLKRLWWCCILRDRIMALGLRRSLQIKPTDFDFSQPGILEEDIKDEIAFSEVYDPVTKRHLAHLTVSLCEMAVAMNETLLVCYPSEMEANKHQRTPQELRDLFLRLDEWHQTAAAKFQVPVRLPGMHESLTLFANALYIYFFTAKACLNNHIVNLVTNHSSENLYETWFASEEVTDSLQSITRSFIDLKENDLARFLPNTFVAFALLPLLWQISHSGIKHDDGLCAEQDDLGDLCEVVKEFSSLYETTDSLLECVGMEGQV
ncbi:fungal-specific transcription factor domain-containing protein [Dactylonectria estremocensis]|uniref:Fungal-specific transcription factor domain-containing protein n=1 Tax=Dactylonectria estremocensis TaxID=1079267 RepID=A0A9P9J1Y4_9HYPO|nr:fungal-specific transcription factor domain-containing protein [Dactylonectria estremocensis]